MNRHDRSLSRWVKGFKPLPTVNKGLRHYPPSRDEQAHDETPGRAAYPIALALCPELSEEDKKLFRAEPAWGPWQERLAGVVQIQIGNRLNYQHITQLASLSHSLNP